MDQHAYVHFVELAGADARSALREQAQRWREAGVATQLLHSAEQDELWLLVGSAAAPPPPARVAGARIWRFERASAADGAL